ncbi:GGDEF domain-containing protein [Bradyrhizobium sp. 180]|uniref:GGDEF domain-containing protein n=1 Tax=unclassified Bradyrhizobium TaxID=2631580 RepID=UPI001FFAD16C|nr:GGDEF domain-containing protein [Bradyrhizobium sp. CW12]MCK1490874.1 GGDEF domain-containing protein [Bradyrhizobium sp. 180]MCK1528516.1 GGDEF domain-containing protein [Bradyrhizobium sp. 182]MCK1596925.1 GGDEF domain-containing protein [Bradyrhizobium sp. 164]MCK1616142.1 GGDEF domain-containing protein [Bradyrhizobium sp. 159]MCK1644965.1 GGDEF domain-containing protein [Bradyrhizobium sp. 154]MCK1663821.1 GGDEF domain-containing protein [Bradyrhizobium sp. 153]MCK1757411.1 GGDEF dom
MFRRTATSTKGHSLLHVIKLVSPFVMVVVLQAAIAGFSLEVMSSVRAYVAGEALWSRSQKNAVYFLNRYLHSGEASQFAQYRAALAVPIGDQFARWALERDPVDVEVARIGFLQGGNHPDDVPGLIWLYRYFNRVSFLHEAIREWAATDPMLLELSVFGEVIRSELENGPIQNDGRLQFLSSRLSELNTQFTVHAKRFSTVLGEGSRAIKVTLTCINIVTAATLILLLIWHTRRLVLQRQAFEEALHAEKERLAWQASHDWLTGLSNRRAFEASLQSELDNAAAGPLGLILLDLDQFKSVNDTCGHLAGDRLLCQVSRLLQQDRHAHDLVARLGGDEFGLILPRCPPSNAVDIAERLRRSFELFNFAWDDRCFAVTASIGVACITDRNTTLEDAMRRADAACYRAKEKGRNRVQVDGVRPDVVVAAARPREAARA